MARIFLSHSSSDNDLARAMRDWLVAEGWNDLFLDFDPERGIAAGEKWEKALLDAAGRCEAVLFVVTRNWLNSGWCLKEFHLAEKLNKRMFMLLADGLKVPDLPPELTAEWQLVDLTPGADFTAFQVTDGVSAQAREVRFSTIGLQRLRSGLSRAGLDPRFFAWPPAGDPNRPPYPGLRALEGDDAGIFFGREAQTIAALDRLRGLREAAAPRLLSILGASGAGKSSFLRAGLLPRLARDDRQFCVLPVIRPEQAVMSGESGLARSIMAALAHVGHKATRGQIDGMLAAGPDAVARILKILAEVSTVPGFPDEPPPKAPSIVLSIDQGEELFAAGGGAESDAFLRLLAELMVAPQINLIVLVAIRSDSYEALQTAPQLDGLRHETLSLPPMPRGAYVSVINGPAERLSQSGRKLVIEPALTQALLADIEEGGAKDALPLLAFTLELLYLKHSSDGLLTLEDYTTLGRIKGSIEVAVEMALASADGDPRIPKDREQRLVLLRRAFIPWLAGVDRASNSVRRRVARLAEVPLEARPLVECMIAARLLSSDVTLDREITVEPAHEALLRQWSLLQGWLEEDFAAMAALEGVQRAARDWEANARDPGWLAHSAGRLEDAEASHAQTNLSTFLSPSERSYLEACRVTEDARRNRELEEARTLAASRALTVKRTRIGLAAALVLAIAAGIAGWFAVLQRDEAERQRVAAVEQQRKAVASLAVVNSGQAARDNRVRLAAAHALMGYRTLANVETRSAFLDAGRAINPHLDRVVTAKTGSSVTSLAWLNETEFVVATKAAGAVGLERITLLPGEKPRTATQAHLPKVMHDAEDEADIIALTALPDGIVMAARNNGVLEFFRGRMIGDSVDPAHIWSWKPREAAEPYSFSKAAVSLDGRHMVFGGASGAMFVHCAGGNAADSTLECSASPLSIGEVTAVGVDGKDGTAYAAMGDGSVLRTSAGKTPVKLTFNEGDATITALAFSETHMAALVRQTSTGATSLVLLQQPETELSVLARGPVNVGPGQVLMWRNAREIVHNCLAQNLKPGPLCITAMTEGNGTAGLTLETRLAGHDGAANLIAIAPGDGRAASRDISSIHVWRWPSDRSVHGLPAMTPAGGWASLTSMGHGRPLLLSGKDGQALALRSQKDASEQVTLPVVDGDVIAAIDVGGGRVIGRGSTLAFVPEGTSEARHTLDLPAPILPQGGLVWIGAGATVAVSLDDQRLSLVDFSADVPELQDFVTPQGVFEPFGIVANPQRGQLVVSTRDGRVHLFDLKTRAHVRTLASSAKDEMPALLGAEGLAISHDGRHLATTAAGNRIVIYDLDLDTRAILTMGTADQGAATLETKSVAFDAAGRWLAAMDAGNAIAIWSFSGGVAERWVALRLQPSQPNLPAALPTLVFDGDNSLTALTQGSEVVQLTLKVAEWERRMTDLEVDRLDR